VLIWGVDARKTSIDGREIDCASAVKPVADPVQLAAKSTEWQRQATDPPLSSVEVNEYELDDSPGTGFVVCHVPERPFKPYRSEQAGPNYFMRAGGRHPADEPLGARVSVLPEDAGGVPGQGYREVGVAGPAVDREGPRPHLP
jgi:hypothetical protein